MYICIHLYLYAFHPIVQGLGQERGVNPRPPSGISSGYASPQSLSELAASCEMKTAARRGRGDHIYVTECTGTCI